VRILIVVVLLLVATVGGLQALATGAATFVPRPVVEPESVVSVPVSAPPIAGVVSDVQRFVLAINAGWSPADAITATALSIAEDGSGNPAAMSPRNSNGTYDFCLWQVNSAWWPQFGGEQALSDPQTCANAAHVIYLRQGWCAWSTYERSCGAGHTGAYLAFVSCARAIAEGTACKR
jgi:hypothetical protein